MRFDSAYVSPDDPRLICGTPQEQEEAMREFRRQRTIRDILATIKREIPRADLTFGPRCVETDAGELFTHWAGDPGFAQADYELIAGVMQRATEWNWGSGQQPSSGMEWQPGTVALPPREAALRCLSSGDILRARSPVEQGPRPTTRVAHAASPGDLTSRSPGGP